MLLSDNTEKVIKLIDMFDSLNNVDKVRLGVHILDDLGFNSNYDVQKFIILLQDVLEVLDPNSKKVIVNFSKYGNLLFLSALYMELSELEKKKFSVEMLFNIYNTDFSDSLNKAINEKLEVYNYYYSLNL